MKIYFIRHGKTTGNLEKRYIGRTDEHLCREGIDELNGKVFPDADIIFISPMKRCIETAENIYADREYISVNDLRECDFGDFEGKNYSELNGNSDYQKWIDSMGKIPFPNGESNEVFRKRSTDAFIEALKDLSFETAAFIVHGGTIMSVLSELAEPKKDYYDYMCKNGCGFECIYKNGKITDVTERDYL